MTNNQNLPSTSTKATFTGCAMSRLFPAAQFYDRKSVLWVKKEKKDGQVVALFNEVLQGSYFCR